jgi:hypothetical protein
MQFQWEAEWGRELREGHSQFWYLTFGTEKKFVAGVVLQAYGPNDARMRCIKLGLHPQEELTVALPIVALPFIGAALVNLPGMLSLEQLNEAFAACDGYVRPSPHRH